MAFGQVDTDRMYHRCIKPLEKKFPISVIRVDRKEHNREIDTVIMEELNGADLVIADLTYARPSVYYEAGYAERAIPVIYTVRRDYLHSRSGDPDHVRVHFDLLMKNIISWVPKDEQKVERKLWARLAHVLRPLLEDRKRDLARRNEQALFLALSGAQKQLTIERTMRSTFKSMGYRPTPGGVFFLRSQRSTVNVAHLIVTPGIAPKRFSHSFENGVFEWAASKSISDNKALSKFRRSIKRVEHVVFLLSWNKISTNRLKDELHDVSSSFDVLSFRATSLPLRWSTKTGDQGGQKVIQWRSQLAVLGSIRSASDARRRVSEIMRRKEMESGRIGTELYSGSNLTRMPTK